MAVGRLHGRDDAVDADHALAARALRLSPHLYRRGAAARGRRRGRRPSPLVRPRAGDARRRRLRRRRAAADSGNRHPARVRRRRARQGDGHLRLRRGPRARSGAQHRRRPRRVVRLALDLLRRHAVLRDRDGDGAALPADRRPRRRADQPRRRPARRGRPRPDRRRRARASQRHGEPARREPRARSRPVRLQHRRHGRLRLSPAPRRPAADGARPVRVPRLRDGRRGRVHLRHGPVRLDVPGAGLHAGGAAPAALAGRRGAAAGRPRARRDDPARRAPVRPHRGEPDGERRPGPARGVVLPDARRRRRDGAAADHALGGGRPDRPRHDHAVAQPRRDAGRAARAHLAGLEHDQLPAPARRRGRHRHRRQRARVAPAAARRAAAAAFHETFALVGTITACAIVAAARMGAGAARPAQKAAPRSAS